MKQFPSFRSHSQLLLSALFALVMMAGFTACSDTNDDNGGTAGNNGNVNANDTSKEPALSRMEFPKVKGGHSLVLIHTTNDSWGINYSVEWDCDKKAQRWSCYQLDSKTLAINTSRSSDGYPMDPLLPNNQYLTQDCFYGSGFDHGHICPSADRRYTQEANTQTFYLTNMQPQYKAFNGSLSGGEAYKNSWSPWYQLESQVRTWAGEAKSEELYVVKGGTIEDDQILMKNNQPWLLKGEMRIPKYFFVALLQKNASGYKAIGFWMEHVGSYSAKVLLADCAVNIRMLEQKTGIDFFCNLPDETENKVETLAIENVKRAWGL